MWVCLKVTLMLSKTQVKEFVDITVSLLQLPSPINVTASFLNKYYRVDLPLLLTLAGQQYLESPVPLHL